MQKNEFHEALPTVGMLGERVYVTITYVSGVLSALQFGYTYVFGMYSSWWFLLTGTSIYISSTPNYKCVTIHNKKINNPQSQGT